MILRRSESRPSAIGERFSTPSVSCRRTWGRLERPRRPSVDSSHSCLWTSSARPISADGSIPKSYGRSCAPTRIQWRARAPRLVSTEPISTRAPIPERPPITSSVTAEDAHTLLKAIYNDVSLPLYARLDAARIAIRHETPTIAASKPLGGPGTDLAKQLEEGRKRAEEFYRRVREEKQRRIDQNAQAIGDNDE